MKKNLYIVLINISFWFINMVFNSKSFLKTFQNKVNTYI